MSLFIASLNSGSNGNCYYIGNEADAVLIDAGLSCRETEKRMKRLNLAMENVRAVFISHEHADHIGGVTNLSKKFGLPVYITEPTLSGGRLVIDRQQVKTFTPHEPVTVGGLSVTAFPKYHDASDPYSFIISHQAVNVGVFTDLGVACDQLIRYFKQCHAAFLEANYDEAMLENGGYPYHLKKRIRGGLGHLSNTQALDVFTKHRPGFMSHLLLSHLSRNNNDPQLVQSLFDAHAGNTKIVVASRYRESEVYHITHSGEINPPVPLPLLKKKMTKDTRSQLSLF
ncbi:MBL fold metallo-hydrolase [Sediminibacterium soli]|uniref:MBL fold metallo-hydrolase n=1 Tax=Sediminibacterium soli TaxID=2698829 RepID=UPI00137A49D7|nr:MBL fold metallo-hydrolase [Sediminibacterium soli]NCI45640.1 MBL fold metallo-hydrolase [Sediminibacterium soli]